MYIKHIQLENTGPIEDLNFEFPFNNEGKPKPLIIVGQNGSGKSIFLSHIVNSLISAKQVLYDNSEVEQDRVYKYRTVQYINRGKKYYFAKLKFEEGFESIEWQLNKTKDEFIKENPSLPHEADFSHMQKSNESSSFWTNFDQNEIKLAELTNQNCILYFPPNRFEEPAWLNYDNLIAKANFSEIRRIQRKSNRDIIQYSPLSQNKDWLLDIIFDRQTFEIQTSVLPSQQGTDLKIFNGYSGQSSKIYESIIQLLQLILRTDQPIRFGFGKRANRRVSIIQGDTQLINNIFQLSTGEVSVLNLFLSILRDHDIATNNFQGLESLRGIVLIDEIDLHLHSDLQFSVLPALIKKFTNMQFIITTHSPLFVLGMQKEFPNDGFSILKLPEGDEIGIERFEEFQNAYNVFKQSSTFQADLKEILKNQQKLLVFVEGIYDIQYIKKSAELLGKQQILELIEIKDGGGFGNLDKIWKSFESPIVNSLTQDVLLLYDCDTEKSKAEKGKVFKRIVASNPNNPISKGVENIFSSETIERARTQNPRFIDITSATNKTERGEQITIPEKQEVNPDEKGNLCNWICENGTREDFIGFDQIFQILEEFLKQDEQA